MFADERSVVFKFGELLINLLVEGEAPTSIKPNGSTMGSRTVLFADPDGYLWDLARWQKRSESAPGGTKVGTGSPTCDWFEWQLRKGR